MIIYTFAYEGDEFAYTSLRKAKSARAAYFDRGDRPSIARVVLPDRITKDIACALLMRSGYAQEMEYLAG